MDAVRTLIDLLETRGRSSYGGEPVSQAEHALQAAHLAECEQAPPALVAAALLHDVGHLTSEEAEGAADRGIDARHEVAGAEWLARHFPEDVVAPIRLHVDAKRYLCAVDPAYREGLSDASKRSLELQGGPMDGGEVAAFEANPHREAAIRLRHWDDLAKVAGLVTPPPSHYRGLLASLAR